MSQASAQLNTLCIINLLMLKISTPQWTSLKCDKIDLAF